VCYNIVVGLKPKTRRFVMKRLIVLCSVLGCLVAAGAIAGKTQVVQGTFRMLTNGAFAGRSDGIGQRVVGHSPYAIENGTSAGPIGKGMYDTFAYGDGKGIFCEDQSGLGTPAGNTVLVPYICTFGSGMKLIVEPLVTQDLMIDMDATSLDVAADQTDNDGLAIIAGGVGGSSGKPFVIGDDPAFYFCVTQTVADASGIDNNIVGFMEVQTGEVWNADFEARNSYAGIGCLGTAASGLTTCAITIKDEDDGDTVTTTDTTDTATEAVAYKYCTHVSAAGVATYTVNGAAPTTVAAYTFDDGVSVVPYYQYLHTNDVAGEIALTTWEVGYTE